ncbi:17863_t:CDS:2, partial [Cetraspora pellucida]
MDCEFVDVLDFPGSKISFKLPAQVTLTDYYGNVVLNKYIRPDKPSDLWRGPDFFKRLLNDEDVQPEVIETIKDKVLVGFAIAQDLTIDHPLNKIRDVSFCKRFIHENQHGSKSLKRIVKEELDRDIQLTKHHDATEDAIATMELFVKFRELWQEMEPKRDYPKRWLSTTAALVSCPTTPPSSSEQPSSSEPRCPITSIPPPEAYTAISLLGINLGDRKNPDFIPYQVTLINYYKEIILDEYIIPTKEIPNFQDQTGLDPKIFVTRARDLTDVQELVRNKINNKILVGFHLHNILRARIDHPNEMKREIELYPGRTKGNPTLIEVAKTVLNMDILENGRFTTVNSILCFPKHYKKSIHENARTVLLQICTEEYKTAAACMAIYQKYERDGAIMTPGKKKPKKKPSSTKIILPESQTQIIPSSTRVILTQIETHTPQIILSSTIAVLTQFETQTNSIQFTSL